MKIVRTMNVLYIKVIEYVIMWMYHKLLESEEIYMDFQTYVQAFKNEFGNTDTSVLPPFLAIQINIIKEGAGSFYIEVKDGQLNIEPYSYDNRDVLITITQKNLDKLVHGELDPVWAFTTGKLKAEGDLGKALELKNLIKNR